jgi:hypothetical protein
MVRNKSCCNRTSSMERPPRSFPQLSPRYPRVSALHALPWKLASTESFGRYIPATVLTGRPIPRRLLSTPGYPKAGPRCRPHRNWRTIGCKSTPLSLRVSQTAITLPDQDPALPALPDSTASRRRRDRWPTIVLRERGERTWFATQTGLSLEEDDETAAAVAAAHWPSMDGARER